MRYGYKYEKGHILTHLRILTLKKKNHKFYNPLCFYSQGRNTTYSCNTYKRTITKKLIEPCIILILKYKT